MIAYLSIRDVEVRHEGDEVVGDGGRLVSAVPVARLTDTLYLIAAAERENKHG